MTGSWRTTAAGALAAVSVVIGALAALLVGDWSTIDIPKVLEALSTLGLGGALLWLGTVARDDKVSSEEAAAARKQKGHADTWILVLFMALVLAAISGCVNPTAKAAVERLPDDLKILNSYTVPRPGLTEAEAKDVERLKALCVDNAVLLRDALN